MRLGEKLGFSLCAVLTCLALEISSYLRTGCMDLDNKTKTNIVDVGPGRSRGVG